MVSKDCPTIDEHVLIVLVTQQVTIATVRSPKNTLNYSLRDLLCKKGTVKVFYIINIL